MDNHTIALEPCPNPWCEADEREGDFRPQVQYSNFGMVYVACTSCNMAGPTRQHETEAIAAWNTRTPPPAPASVGGDVVEALRFYADLSNPRAWARPTVADARWPDNHRPVGLPVPSDALLADRGALARAALQAQPTASTAQPDDVVERVARALAQAKGIEICSDARYAQSSFRGPALAALAAMQQAPVKLDWRAIAKAAGEHGVRYRTNSALMAFFAQIGLTQPQPDAAVAVEPVTLNECPPGLFMFNGTLCFKSEYTTTLENPRRYQIDAYCVESGEYFHGGAKSSSERGNLMVEPVDITTIRAGGPL